MEGTPTQERILPTVSIEQNLSPMQKIAKGRMTNEDFLIKNENGETIGNFTLLFKKSPQPEEGGIAYLNTINVNGARGKGYGRAAYVQIINHLEQRNITFKSSEFQLSRGSKKAWDWLVEQGLARLVDKGVTDESKEDEGYSTAQYEVI